MGPSILKDNPGRWVAPVLVFVDVPTRGDRDEAIRLDPTALARFSERQLLPRQRVCAQERTEVLLAYATSAAKDMPPRSAA